MIIIRGKFVILSKFNIYCQKWWNCRFHFELHTKNEQKWSKFTNLTLKYDLLTLEMTPGGVENVTIELSVLKNPHLDPENVFLALLEVILFQDSSSSFRFKLKTPIRGRSSLFLKDNIGRYIFNLDSSADLPRIIIGYLSPFMSYTQNTSNNDQN